MDLQVRYYYLVVYSIYCIYFNASSCTCMFFIYKHCIFIYFFVYCVAQLILINYEPEKHNRTSSYFNDAYSYT